MMYQKEVDAVHSGKKDAFNLTYRVRDEDGVFVSCTGHGRIKKKQNKKKKNWVGLEVLLF